MLKKTLIGALSVLFWSFSLPINRLIQDKIGMLNAMALVYPGMAVLGFLYYFSYKGNKFPWHLFKDRLFYLHWFLLILNCCLVYIGICFVPKHNLPVVILVNYFWPTSIILISVLTKELKVSNPILFTFGTIIVLGSLTFELTSNLFLHNSDLFDRNSILAYSSTFLGAVCWGVYSVMSRKYNNRLIGGPALPIYQSIFIFLLPIGYYNTDLTAINPQAYALIIFFCLLQGSGFISWEFGMRYGNVLILSLLADFIPLLSLLFTNIIHNIDIKYSTLIAFSTLLTGAIMTRVSTTTNK